MRKILTIEQLVNFCEERKFYNFSSKDMGYQLCVQIPATFEKESDNDSSLLFVKVKVFHTGLNRNKSNVTVEAAKHAMKNMAYKPILANIIEVNGVKDFSSHDGYIDDDGNWIYEEKQIGCFTSDKPYMEQDENNEDRYYVFAHAAIPREYTDAAEIIERKNGTKVSVTTSKGKEANYNFNSELAKVEISNEKDIKYYFVIEYTLTAKNVGYIDGYVKSVIIKPTSCPYS